MIFLDAGDSATPPDDYYDGGDSATPPDDFYDSLFLMTAQSGTGQVTPTFTQVDPTELVTHEPGLALIVRAGGDTTTATVTVPGTQPYTGAPRDDLAQAGIQNAERVFYLPALLTDPDTEVVTVSYSDTTGVFAALLKVN